jgi:hypothetical protein
VRLFVESLFRSIFLFEHDLFRKSVSTFPVHPLAETNSRKPDRCGARVILATFGKENLFEGAVGGLLIA